MRDIFIIYIWYLKLIFFRYAYKLSYTYIYYKSAGDPTQLWYKTTETLKLTYISVIPDLFTEFYTLREPDHKPDHVYSMHVFQMMK